MAVAGFGACATYRPKPLSAEQTEEAFSRRTLADPGLKTFVERNSLEPRAEWPPQQWSLDDFILVAIYYHADLDVARAQWAVAEAGEITAGERPNPTLNISPGYSTTASMLSPWLPLAALDIPIESPSKRKYRIGQARQLSEAARLGILSAAWQVRSKVRSSLVAVWSTSEAETLLSDQEALQAESIELLEGQYRAGAISAFELSQARTTADVTRLALDDAARQEVEARIQLADAVGVPYRALEGIDISFDELISLPAEASSADARRQALLNRPDILGALADYGASQSALQMEIAKQYPDIHLGPGYQYDQGDNKWWLGITVDLPVFNQNQGGIAEAEARRAEAAAKFAALQARVLADIDRTLAGYHAALRKRDDADAMIDNLRRQETIARAMFDIGEISKSDLASLRLQLGSARLSHLEAVTQSQQALAALEDTLQSPLGLPPEAWQSTPRVAGLATEDETP